MSASDTEQRIDELLRKYRIDCMRAEEVLDPDNRDGVLNMLALSTLDAKKSIQSIIRDEVAQAEDTLDVYWNKKLVEREIVARADEFNLLSSYLTRSDKEVMDRPTLDLFIRRGEELKRQS